MTNSDPIYNADDSTTNGDLPPLSPEIEELIRNNVRKMLQKEKEKVSINTENFRYYEYPSTGEFRFSSHDLFIENTNDDAENIEGTAYIHYLPNNVMDLSQVPESERNRFKLESIKNFIIGLKELLNFIQNNPNTILGKVKIFKGETNLLMANFFKNKLLIDYHKIENEKELYLLIFHLEQLILGMENIKTRYPNIAKSSQIA